MENGHGEFLAAEHAKHAPQPVTDIPALMAMIAEFEAKLPGWWWSVCVCHLTRDASCGPDIAGPDYSLLQDREFDAGFHCDDSEGTLASSLRDVMEQALAAKSRYAAPSQKGGE